MPPLLHLAVAAVPPVVPAGGDVVVVVAVPVPHPVGRRAARGGLQALALPAEAVPAWLGVALAVVLRAAVPAVVAAGGGVVLVVAVPVLAPLGALAGLQGRLFWSQSGKIVK